MGKTVFDLRELDTSWKAGERLLRSTAYVKANISAEYIEADTPPTLRKEILLGRTPDDE